MRPEPPLLLRGGRVVSPEDGLDEPADVLVRDGRVEAVGRGLPVPAGARVVDCAGAVVAPALVDIGTETCDPGPTWREDLRSASEAGAAGGFALLAASPATDPVVDTAAVAGDLLARAATLPGAAVRPMGALTRGLAGQELAEIGLLVEAGCPAISDGDRALADALVLRRALEYLRPFGVAAVLRPAEPALEEEGCVHEGPVALRVGLRGIPDAAEAVGVARLVELCRLTGARVHLLGVTTRRSLGLLARAKDEGLPVTASAPARHLLLTDAAIEEYPFDPRFRLLPPLRPDDDRAALVDAARSGLLDALDAGHRPRGIVDKELEFERAEPGGAGLETALGAALEALDGDVAAAVRLLACAPARVLDRRARVAPGADADIVVFDPDARWIAPPPARSRAATDPLEGRRLRGRVRLTVAGGRTVFGPIAVQDAAGGPARGGTPCSESR